jgi:HK97 family phage major capsid protein
MSGKTIGEHLASLKETRAELQARLQTLAQKSMDESRSLNTGEQEEFDTVKQQIKALDSDIARFSDLETMQAKTASPVGGKSEQRSQSLAPSPLNTMQIKSQEKTEPGIGFARAARCLALAKQEGVSAQQVAKTLYPNDGKLHDNLQIKTAVAAANTSTATYGGNLILDAGAAFADFAEYLRPRSILGQISSRLRSLPFDTPVLVQGSGATAKWVGEGKAKPLTATSWTKTKLTPLKVAAIAAATKEQLARASIAADMLLRDELARAVGAAIDTTFVSDDAAVSAESPAGIRNGVSALTLTGDGTVSGVRCDIAQYMTELVGDNLSVSGAFWIMPETVAIHLSLQANEVGAPAFPGVTPTGGTLAGLPVFTSQYVPVDTNGSVVMLVKGDEIFLGDEGGVQVSISDQASLQMDDAPSQNSTSPTASTMVSLWQTNSVGFLVERFLNFQKRRASAVVWGYVNWTACPVT